MPITKTKSIKSEKNLTRAVKYILNPDKTEEQILTSGYKINHLNSAAYEMMLTRSLAQEALKTNRKTEVLARHLIQSFDPKDHLTPEQIHEIGRQTILDLTGGQCEFIIATHIDKDHIHNHIIFNATNFVDLKKFRWHKGTPALLRSISDMHAEFAHAHVLENRMRNSYTKYQVWRRKNIYRVILKERLDFLIKYSKDIDDFKIKAALLNVSVDFSGKEAKYKLLDYPQQRNIRDATLSKKNRNYSLEKISERLKQNEFVFSVSEVVPEFEKIQKEKKENPELVLTVEAWQVKRETQTGIYLEIEFGKRRFGTVRIPDYKIDRIENGDYVLHLNRSDFFHFLDNKNRTMSKYINATTLINQLSRDSQKVPERHHSAMKTVREAIAAINILSERNIKGEQAVKALGEEFVKNLQEIEKAILKVEERMGQLNESLKFDKNNPEKRQLLKEIQREYSELKNAYKGLEKKVSAMDYTQEVLGKDRDRNEKPVK